MNISKQWVDQLFGNEYFVRMLDQFRRENKIQDSNIVSSNRQITMQSLIDDINQTLYTSFKSAIEKQCNHLYESNAYIINQIQAIKLKLTVESPRSRTSPQTLSHQDIQNKLSTSIFFGTDLKTLRHNIDSIQQEIAHNNSFLMNSFELYQKSHNTSREQREKQFEIQEKVNLKVDECMIRIEEAMKIKHQSFELNIEQRIEQLKKTITSVVQAMNDPQFWVNNNPQLNDKKVMAKDIDTHMNTSPYFITNEPNEDKSNKTQLQTPKKIDLSHSQPTSSSSNKSMNSLNKSINFGKTKIKSLFGFKSNNLKPQQSQFTSHQ